MAKKKSDKPVERKKNVRIMVEVEAKNYAILVSLADKERRFIKDQLNAILEKEFRQLGLIKD
jgi:hypothetical protein